MSNEFRIPGHYRDWGGPLRWQDEQSGELRRAIMAYLNHQQKPMYRADMKIVCEWLRYYIAAPCWDANPHHDEDSRAVLAELRARIIAIQHGALATEAEIEQWIMDCLEIGVDPL